jgi:propanol-preferring alcohol dehydrogenase
MKAMMFKKVGTPLQMMEVPTPVPGPDQLLIQVHACGICRTDLHIIDGELPNPKLPLILGHEIVGTIMAKGQNVNDFTLGDRVGIPWLASTCSQCKFCLEGKENLCADALYTGYTVDGGFAEFCLANPDYVFPIPDKFDDLQAAPLLCAGLIGFRSYRKIKQTKNIGFYGFGSSAHILIQIARQEGKNIYVFSRPGQKKPQDLAVKLGAVWIGDSTQLPPIPLDAAIIFAPAGELIPAALKAIDKGGSVICAGIHMSDIPAFPYHLLWGERSLASIANLTRLDGLEFMDMAKKTVIETTITSYPLEKANEALKDVREGRIAGTAVLDLRTTPS